MQNPVFKLEKVVRSKSEEEMRKLFPYAQEAIDNTHKIAERCNVEIEFGVTKLPKYEVPEGFDSWTYLNHLCREGFKTRYPDDDGTVRGRLQYEIDMIAKMGFVDYFLIVSDFIGYAKSQGIPVGPGRGSAAGSIVSYCLGITDLDPIHYSLYFERFLNPERVSMPDIDVDFCYVRRPSSTLPASTARTAWRRLSRSARWLPAVPSAMSAVRSTSRTTTWTRSPSRCRTSCT